MSASYFDLLKYAATGIASPSMTYYDRMRASTLMGGAVQTLTDVPPLTFKADGTPLISWSMKGNGVQSGTPTPDNPVIPEFVGAMTANLYEWPYTSTWGVDGTGQNRTINDSAYTRSSVVKLKPNTQYTLSAKAAGSNDMYCRIAIFDEKPQIGSVSTHYYFSSNDDSTTFTTGADEEWGVVVQNNATAASTDLKRMLNDGSTALPYEPFGWAEKITCAGQTVPVYFGQVSTVRRVRKMVLDGTETWDWISNGTGSYARMTVGQINSIVQNAVISSHFEQREILSSTQVVGVDVRNVASINAATLNIRPDDADTQTLASFTSYLAAQYAAGHPVTIWYALATPTTGIVNEPLAKIGDYADELHSEDAAVTIPTVKGSNTLTVGGDLQPSEMTITYRG